MKRHLLLFMVCVVLFLALLLEARRHEVPPSPRVAEAGQDLAMTVRTLNSGENHMCFRDRIGILWCWGNNLKGQLGNVDFALQATPQAVRFRRPFSMMEGGADHSCGLTLTGQVLCWGDPAMGVLGDGGASVQPDARPVTVTGLSRVVKIASGFDGTCALQANGRIVCWGTTGRSNSRQRIRLFRIASRPESVTLPELAVDLGFGPHHACAVGESGAAYCWGFNAMGALGDGSVEDRMEPVQVRQLPEKLTSITPGYLQTCAITASRHVLCWGANYENQLGDGLRNPDKKAMRPRPGYVPGLENVVQLSGSSHTCALKKSGQVVCWGYNEYGSAGQDPAVYPNVPVPMSVTLDEPIAELAHNEWGMCALTRTDRVFCWGSNKAKLLGARPPARPWIPVPVKFPEWTAPQ